MRLIAVDASLSICGIASGHVDAAEPRLEAVRMPTASKQGSLVDAWLRLSERLDACHHRLGGTDLVVVEDPPKAWSDDGSGRAKRQAGIGFGLGRAVQLVDTWAAVHGVECWLCPNGDMRAWGRQAARTVPRTAARSAASATGEAMRPEVMIGGGWRLRWSGCAHELHVGTLKDLAERPRRCPTCSGSGAAANERQQHKEPWVDIARQLWPGAVEEVITSARGRSKARAGVQVADYALSGVADACDAALLWGMVRDQHRHRGAREATQTHARGRT